MRLTEPPALMGSCFGFSLSVYEKVHLVLVQGDCVFAHRRKTCKSVNSGDATLVIYDVYHQLTNKTP